MRAADARATWLMTFAEVSDPVCELVCFPHAGGGASAFASWQGHTDAVSVAALRLPGRERRFGEPAVADIDVLSDQIAHALSPRADRPYAFFGHSMGALLAFAVTRRLRALDRPMPRALFVAGCDAPQVFDPERTHDLPRDELVGWLTAHDGLDAEALRYPELIDLMLPTVRADLAVAENYAHRDEPPLPVPIHVLRGRQDHQTGGSAATAGWAAQTSAGWAETAFDGGHFFVHDHDAEVVALVERVLRGDHATGRGAP